MSFQFPSSTYKLNYPSTKHPTTLPSDIPHNITPLITSRRKCSISYNDGEHDHHIREMSIEDTKQELTIGSIHYCQSTLDIPYIKSHVPPNYHIMIDDTIGLWTAKFYKEQVSELIIEWSI